MRKRILCAVAALMMAVMCLSFNVLAYQSGSIGIDDQADLYTDEQKAELEAKQKELAEYTGWNIAVVTTTTGFGEDGSRAIKYAEQYYDDTFGSSSSGLLYLIDTDYRHFCIAGTADYEYFNNTRVKAMVDTCNGYYMDYKDYENVDAFYDCVRKYYDMGPFSSSEDKSNGLDGYDFGVSAVSFSTKLIIGLIAGVIAAAIGVICVISRYKFHEQVSANKYLDGGNINFYQRSDRFVREYTTRTKIESDSGGGHGSGGGGGHGGGGAGGSR